MAYLLTFFGSVGLMALGQYIKRGKLFWWFSVAGLLLPCLLAGFRDYSVGTDVVFYLKPMFECALESDNLGSFFAASWQSSLGIRYVHNYEYGFTVLIFVLAKLTGSMQAVMLGVQAVILVPVYIALCRKRRSFPVWLGMLVYYLLFFNASLNLMRQLMGMSFVLLGFSFMRDRKWICGVCVSLVSVAFHYSCAVFVPIAGIYALLLYLSPKVLTLGRGEGKLSVSWSVVICCLIALIGMLLVLHTEQIADLLKALGLDRFDFYLRGQKAVIVPTEILLRLPILTLLLWYWPQFRQHTDSSGFYLCTVLLEIVSSQLTGINPYAYRIPLYFALYTVFLVPEIYCALTEKRQKVLLCVVSVGYFLFLWRHRFFVEMLHQTFPFVFIWSSHP